MKKIIFLLFLSGFFSLYALSIYDIQYTSAPGIGNTFPSLYTGKTVTIQGIVNAIDYPNGGFFVTEQTGGPWRGIYISENKYSIRIGDYVSLKGTVNEIYGMTCIERITEFRTIDSNRYIPLPLGVTTGQLIRADEAEAYEGVLVKVQGATCSQNTSSAGIFILTDGTGNCRTNIQRIADQSINLKPKNGDHFSNVTGIIYYAFGEYTICPRFKTDVTVMMPTFIQNRSWGRIKSIYK